MSAELERIFPALATDGYVVVSPETTAYNCIAWAAGESHRWWEPGICWLIQPGDDLATLIGLLASLGYAPCDGDRLEVGCQRGGYADNFGNCTHAARQLIRQDSLKRFMNRSNRGTAKEYFPWRFLNTRPASHRDPIIWLA